MRNIAFAIWMVGYAVVGAMEEHFYRVDYGTKDTTPLAISAAIGLVIWIGIGKLLYEKKPN
jgi:hypothetical protein